MQTFGRYKANLVTITVEQMRMVDYLMENKYGINLFQMMENAGRSLALLTVKYLMDEKIRGKKIAVLAGKGGNGGGVIVAARRLKNWGAEVHVFLSHNENELKTITKEQLEIIKKIGIKVWPAESLNENDRYDLILDGIYGYALKGQPDKNGSNMIDWANGQLCPVISLDSPSGIEMETGKIHIPAIKADATLTIALPKKALLSKASADHVGELFLTDISVPAEVYHELNLEEPIPDYFATGDIVLLESANQLYFSTQEYRQKTSHQDQQE